MKTSTFTWTAVLATLAFLAVPRMARADYRAQNEDRVIRKLLTARDPDDRGDAADALGKWGALRALRAVEYAAVHDRHGYVRNHATKAALKIRLRLRLNFPFRQPLGAAIRPPVIIIPPVGTTPRAPGKHPGHVRRALSAGPSVMVRPNRPTWAPATAKPKLPTRPSARAGRHGTTPSATTRPATTIARPADGSHRSATSRPAGAARGSAVGRRPGDDREGRSNRPNRRP